MPFRVGIQLTTRCNLACQHCFVDKASVDLPVEVFESAAAFAAACNCRSLDLTGGEPTLHPRLSECLDIARRHGLKLTLVTNGWNFVEFYRTIRPRAGALAFLAFSLDGATAAVHDAARCDGSFHRILQALSVCRSVSIPFSLQTTLTRRNLGDVEGMAFLAAKVGAQSLLISPVQPTPAVVEAGLLPSPDDFRRVVREVERFRTVVTVNLSLGAGFPDADPFATCPPLTMRQLFIQANGTVGFCCQLGAYAGAGTGRDVIGHLRQMSLFEAYQRMAAAVAEYRQFQALRLAVGARAPLDDFPCWWCLKHFGKVDWMPAAPGDPWGADLRAWRRERGGPQP